VPLVNVALEVPVVPVVPIIPLFADALYVTRTPAGVAAVYPESVELPVAFVATDLK
jgi:hypothetical protein